MPEDMRKWVERPLAISSGGRFTLFGMCYLPQATPRGVMVICPPCFEERKSSHRPLVDLARAVAATGWSVARFDYRGCGESDGDFRDGGVNAWVEDTICVSNYVRKAWSDSPLVFLGLRLGAAISWLAARQTGGADGLAILEPVTSGRAYLEQELRKKLVRDMVTYGKATTSRHSLINALEHGESVDFDGYPITPSFFAELKQMDILSWQPPPVREMLLLEIGSNCEPSPIARAIHERVTAAGTHCAMACVYCQPFWNLIGLSDISSVITTTNDWLGRLWPSELSARRVS